MTNTKIVIEARPSMNGGIETNTGQTLDVLIAAMLEGQQAFVIIEVVKQ